VKKITLFLMLSFVSFFSPISYKIHRYKFFMENKIFEDIGEEILFKLREINQFLEKLLEAKNGNECPVTLGSR